MVTYKYCDKSKMFICLVCKKHRSKSLKGAIAHGRTHVGYVVSDQKCLEEYSEF